MNDLTLTFEFGVPIAVTAAGVLLAAVAVVVGLFWWSRLRPLPLRKRTTLVALRVAGLLVLLFMLLDPTMVRRGTKPGEDYVVVLFDDSKSMRIAGQDGVSRGERLRAAYTAARDAFENKLRDRHQLAFYRFGSTATRLGNIRELSFDQNESDPVGAVNAAVRDLAGATVSAVVLFSDGVPQGPAAQADRETALNSSVPIYAVGADTEAPWRDLELKSVAVTRTNFDKSPVSVTLQVGAAGLNGRQAVAEVMEGERIAASKPFAITSDPFESKILLEFVPQTKGWIACQGRVRLVSAQPVPQETPTPQAAAPPETERITENNSRGFVVDNRDHTYHILYLCGRPNWENGFIRRALEGDDQLKLSSLIRLRGPDIKFVFHGDRTSMNNQLFEGFDESEVVMPRYDEAVFRLIDPDHSEPSSGYPLQEKDLFPFDLVIWGDIESDYFSQRQMELTRDFVAKRGGSFLMLGGPRTLAEGHFAGTLIESMLPVVLHASGNSDTSIQQSSAAALKQLFHVQPTAEGFLSGVWSLDRDASRNAALWNALPDLYGLNEFAMLRAGATEQARVAGSDGSSDGQPLFAWQPYGLGRCAVLATGETWQWKMEEGPEDATHERFWRQLIRSLVSPVPSPVVLRSGSEDATLGHSSKLDFLVRDAQFEKREGLNTAVQVIRPGQPPLDLPAEESIAEPGVYDCEFTPESTGLHLVNLTALNDKNEVVGSLQDAMFVEPDLREYHNANYNSQFLKTIATRSHGAFYGLDRLGDVADRIPRSAVAQPLQEVYHLWRYPAFFAWMAALLCMEWYLRRKYGQP